MSEIPSHLTVGNKGEQTAKEYLNSIGFTILEENWRYKNHHEIDIICLTQDQDLVAVEVRTHDSPQNYKPFESIEKGKINRIKQALRMYVNLNVESTPPMRVDVISVINSINEIEHFEAVDNQL